MFRSLAFTLVVPFAVACGAPPDVEDQAAGAQALLEGGDTLEDAAGDEGDEGDDGGDDEAALDEAGDADDCTLPGLRERVIARYDADGDGSLGEDERAAMRADVEAHPRLERAIERHRMLRRAIGKRLRFIYDADDSRSLDDAERAALRSDLEARCVARQARVLERYDVDGDGALSEGERAQLRTDRQARIAERRAELLARFDVDGDGLDDAEKAALRDHLRARVRLEAAGDEETEL